MESTHIKLRGFTVQKDHALSIRNMVFLLIDTQHTCSGRFENNNKFPASYDQVHFSVNQYSDIRECFARKVGLCLLGVYRQICRI